ncbi:sigma-70 family RNA polymerase sigma factor [Rapidithrix thailandica]|uniref:Sigma-70 family RNA polymerase sigma factor n=1 Tax=Rapidithrix thailandica TaxID=413964 RepID=A0AAW9S485_9BACT
MHQSEKEIQDELAIIQQAKKDPEVFGFLYEKYYSAIFHFVERRVEGASVAGDLVSQVFLKALMNLPGYKFKGVPFSAWLYRIASNQVNEYYRSSQRERVVSLEPYHFQSLFDEAELEKPKLDQEELLIGILNELEEAEVQILELRFFEERSFKEVAFILGITENHAKVKTYRILDKVRKLVQGSVYGKKI